MFEKLHVPSEALRKGEQQVIKSSTSFYSLPIIVYVLKHTCSCFVKCEVILLFGSVKVSDAHAYHDKQTIAAAKPLLYYLLGRPMCPTPMLYHCFTNLQIIGAAHVTVNRAKRTDTNCDNLLTIDFILCISTELRKAF